MLLTCVRRNFSFQWPLRALRPNRRLLSTNGTSFPPITAVEKIIMDGIKATGPISFSTYMQLCLSHPTQGYYMNPNNRIFGTRGDFITSPEISSVFGELLGVWLMSQWARSPKLPIRIVELGPGRGTLMHDVLRVVGQFAKNKLKSVHLVETSPSLRALQNERLSPSTPKYGCTLEWHDSIEQILPSSEEYTMLIAHEFFDALPFHVVEKTEVGWQEILIALADSAAEDPLPRFRYVMSPQPTAASTLLGLSSPRFRDLRVGARLEVSPLAFKTMRKVGELVCGTPAPNDTDPDSTAHPNRGCALIVDYGDNHSFSSSFRAFKNHKIVDVFDTPGECDLTANVDFAFLTEAVQDIVMTHGPMPQSAFLEGMGLALRIESLVRATDSDAQKSAVREAGERLVASGGMGKEYMMLGVGGQVHQDHVWPFPAALRSTPSLVTRPRPST